MIKPARVDLEKICVLMKALFCRNTLCIARKSDEIRAQIFRKTPQAIDSAFTKTSFSQAAQTIALFLGRIYNTVTDKNTGSDPYAKQYRHQPYHAVRFL